MRRGGRYVEGVRHGPAIFAGCLLLAAACRLALGSTGFGITDAVVLDLRLHRLILAGLAGAMLAISGVALQGLLRNDLAEPFLLGLSTGAGLGMAIGATFGGAAAGGPGAVLGAAAVTAIVYAAGRRGGVLDPFAVLLTGVVLSTFCGAVLMLLIRLAGPLLGASGGAALGGDVALWMMGRLNTGLHRGALVAVMAVAGVMAVALWRMGPAADAATFADDEAVGLGVDLRRLRRVQYAAAAVLAALAVWLAGPVAFVGLIAPHVARGAVGGRHRRLIPAAAAVGAALLIAADTAGAAAAAGSRALGHPLGTLPPGLFTAALGGLAILAILRRRPA